MPRSIEVRTIKIPEPKLNLRNVRTVLLYAFLGAVTVGGAQLPIPGYCIPTDADSSLYHARLQAFASNQETQTKEELDALGYQGAYRCNVSLTDAVTSKALAAFRYYFGR